MNRLTEKPTSEKIKSFTTVYQEGTCMVWGTSSAKMAWRICEVLIDGWSAYDPCLLICEHMSKSERNSEFYGKTAYYEIGLITKRGELLSNLHTGIMHGVMTGIESALMFMEKQKQIALIRDKQVLKENREKFPYTPLPPFRTIKHISNYPFFP